MRFLRTNIHNRLVVLMLTAIIIPMLISTLFSYFYTKNSLITHSVNESAHLLEQGNINISNYISRLNAASLSIYSDTRLANLFTNNDPSAASEYKPYSETLLSIFQYEKSIDQVYLSMNKTKEAFLLDNNLAYRQKQLDTLYSSRFEKGEYNAFIEPPHVRHPFDLYKPILKTTEKVLTLHRPLYKVPSTESVGWLAIDINTGALEEIYSRLYSKDKEDFYILDESGDIIFASDNNKQIIKYIMKQWDEQILIDDNPSWVVDVNDSDFSGVLIFSTLETSLQRWILVKSIPTEVLYGNVGNLVKVNSLVTGLSLIVAIILVWIVSSSITNPIRKLTDHAIAIEAGSLHKSLHIESEDEIGILGDKFQDMMDTINNLVIHQYEQNLVNTTTQLKMLQAQINPHFLNNALQSIGHVALENQQSKVYSLISSLGQMMNYSMNINDIHVTLSGEFNYIKHYLNLQQERFGRNISIEMNNPENTQSITLPKMILQPLVENYFKHGFIRNSNENKLQIHSFIENNYLFIHVQDNGPGMTETKRQEILTSLTIDLENSQERGQHIGLLNVIRRLKIYFGEKANLTLESNKPHGLKVILMIPIKGSDDFEGTTS